MESTSPPDARRTLRTAFQALSLVLLSLHTHAAQAHTSGARDTVESILARADRPDAPSAQVLAQDMIDMGTNALPKVFDALVAEAQRPRGLESRRARVIYATCAIAGTARWRPVVEARLVPGASSATFRAFFALIGECGRSSEISFLVRGAELDAARSGRSEFERAMTAVLLRDPIAFEGLDSLLATTSNDTLCSVIRAVEATRRGGAAAVLSRWIGAQRDLRLTALPHLSRLALSLEKPIAEEVLRPVRNLLDQVENETVADAIVCAGRLGDCAAVPALIRWLRDGSPGIRANALWSLRAVSDLVLDEDPAAWANWFAAESAWWENESKTAFALLRQGSRLEKTRVLRDIAGLHAWRDKLAERVVVLLEDEDAELATYAAHLLGRLRSRVAVPALLDALDHASCRVSAAAHAALENIVGRELPDDAVLCRDALGPHG